MSRSESELSGFADTRQPEYRNRTEVKTWMFTALGNDSIQDGTEVGYSPTDLNQYYHVPSVYHHLLLIAKLQYLHRLQQLC